jgi:hypothetical protein
MGKAGEEEERDRFESVWEGVVGWTRLLVTSYRDGKLQNYIDAMRYPCRVKTDPVH